MNNKLSYPSDIDLAWLASDSLGQIAAFTTGGEGPIPDWYLLQNRLEKDDIETHLTQLPDVSEIAVRNAQYSAESHCVICRKGIFVFDWTDVHRTIKQSLNVYENVAAPNKPITIGKLSPILKNAVKHVAIENIIFSSISVLDIRSQLACTGPADGDVFSG